VLNISGKRTVDSMDDNWLPYDANYIVLVIFLPISAAVLCHKLGLDVEPTLHATGTRRFALPILLAIMIATDAIVIYRTCQGWTIAAIRYVVVECAQTAVGLSTYFIIGSTTSKRLSPEQDVLFDEEKHFRNAVPIVAA